MRIIENLVMLLKIAIILKTYLYPCAWVRMTMKSLFRIIRLWFSERLAASSSSILRSREVFLSSVKRNHLRVISLEVWLKWKLQRTIRKASLSTQISATINCCTNNDRIYSSKFRSILKYFCKTHHGFLNHVLIYSQKR